MNHGQNSMISYMGSLSYAFKFVKDVHVKIKINKLWNRQIEEGLLNKKRAHNKYLLLKNENDRREYESQRHKEKDD